MGKIMAGDTPVSRLMLGDAEISKAFAGDEPVFNRSRYRVNISTSLSSSEVTVNGVPVGDGETVPYGEVLRIVLSYQQSYTQQFNVKHGSTELVRYLDAACTRPTTSIAAGRYYLPMPGGNVKITSSSTTVCIPSGVMITMADGSRRAVEDVTAEDRVLAFNHETGRFTGAAIIFLEADGVQDWPVLHLAFSDGSRTALIYEHGYFDLDLMRYVYIREDNYAQYVGHRFAKVAEGGGIEAVTLRDAWLATERTGCFSFPSAYHLNFVADGFLSMPGGIEGMFNFFDYAEDLSYDGAAMAADIERYGLMSYEDFAAYMSREEYGAYPAPFLGVALGKGIMTRERLEYLIERYVAGKR